jgi:hypothetical protein
MPQGNNFVIVAKIQGSGGLPSTDELKGAMVTAGGTNISVEDWKDPSAPKITGKKVWYDHRANHHDFENALGRNRYDYRWGDE